MALKIAFLIASRDAAEWQAFQVMRIAAERLGHQLVHCADSMEIEGTNPDFVLAVAPARLKLTGHPTFGVIHASREHLLLNREYFTNLLTYDGYLTITETVERFVTDVLAGIGRTSPIGRYGSTPYRVPFSAPIEQLAENGQIRLTYCGTHCDERQLEVFQLLEAEELIEIYGPAAAWSRLTGTSYKGALPFDVEARERTYARNGAGLVMLSRQQHDNDAISNRVFEIASVGAVAIACDIPWLRENFGDSVYYYRESDCAARTVERIRDILFEVQEDPQSAAQRARQAREIFSRRFAAEVLLQNAVEYFEGWVGKRTLSDRSSHPGVSVIVQCGDRPRRLLRRAIESLKSQTYGRVTVLLLARREFDAQELLSMAGGAIVAIRVIPCIGAQHTTTVCTGLRAVDTEYFAFLDDHIWFPTHLERIFEAKAAAPDAQLLISARVLQKRQHLQGSGTEQRTIVGFRVPTLGSNSFIASASLLEPMLDPAIESTDTPLVLLRLLGKTRPVFSYAATVLQIPEDRSRSYLDWHSAEKDELALLTRHIRELDSLYGPDQTFTLLSTSLLRAQSSDDATVKVVNGVTVYAWSTPEAGSFEPWADTRRTIPLDSLHVALSGESSFLEYLDPESREFATSVEVVPPPRPWTYGAVVQLGLSDKLERGGTLLVRGEVFAGFLGFSVVDGDCDALLFRHVVPTGRFELRVPLFRGANVGQLVIHKWDDASGACAEVELVEILGAGRLSSSRPAQGNGHP